MQPILQQILLKPFPSDDITTGGLFVPESCQERNNKMEVIEVGSGSTKHPMKFRKGQTVFAVQNWGTEIIINGEKHYLMDQRTILATL